MFNFMTGTQAGSPMPVRPPSGQIDGQNRMTQSPMATQGKQRSHWFYLKKNFFFKH